MSERCQHQTVEADVSPSGQVTISQRSATGDRLNLIAMHVDQLSALSAWCQSKAARRDGSGGREVVVSVCTRTRGASE